MMPVTSETRSVIANASPGPRLRSLPAGRARRGSSMIGARTATPDDAERPRPRSGPWTRRLRSSRQVVDERHHLAVVGGAGAGAGDGDVPGSAAGDPVRDGALAKGVGVGHRGSVASEASRRPSARRRSGWHRRPARAPRRPRPSAGRRTAVGGGSARSGCGTWGSARPVGVPVGWAGPGGQRRRVDLDRLLDVRRRLAELADALAERCGDVRQLARAEDQRAR